VATTAAIARTAVNVRAGATSRLAAFTHAIALAAFVLVAAPLVGRIPVAALAGVLLATCVQTVEVGSLTAIVRATRGDALVLIATFVVTVAVNLVTAVALGVAIAVVLALRSVSRSAVLQQVPLDTSNHDREEHALLCEHMVAYRIDGPLFFAAAHRFLLELTEIAEHLRRDHLVFPETPAAIAYAHADPAAARRRLRARQMGKCHRGCSGDVERVDAVGHRDPDPARSLRHRRFAQPGPLGTQQYRPARRRHDPAQQFG